ncbi:MAG: AI-2E family transporter [Candidatus Paceibacterota bacterium]|jgi:predicted PurR-regulated permease PerM
MHDTKFSITNDSIVRVIFWVVLAVLIFLLRDLIIAIVASVVIASAIEPAIRWLGNYRMPRIPSVISIYLGTAILLLSIFYFFVPPLFNDMMVVSRQLPQMIAKAEIFAPITDNFPQIVDGLRQQFSLVDAFVPGGAVSTVGGNVVHTAGVLVGSLFMLILILVLSFYLAVQEHGIDNFIRLVASDQYEEYLIDLWKRSRKKIGYWMQGQVLLGLLIGVFVYLGLAVFGIKYALLLAVLAAIFEIIPVFGPILSAVPGVLLGFSQGYGMGLFILGFYIIIQQFENHLIYPLVVRKIVGIPPILVILSLIVGGQLFGFLGILIAVPIATILMEVLGDHERRKLAGRQIAQNKQ